MKDNIPDKTAWDELITYHITEPEYEEHAACSAHADDFLIYNKIQDHCFRPSLLWEAAKVIPGFLPKFNFVAKMVVSIDHLTNAHPLLFMSVLWVFIHQSHNTCLEFMKHFNV